MIRAATRGSPLALAQTRMVGEALGVEVEPVVVETGGDRRADVPIWAIGGQGVFVKEVQIALLDGRADIAVHSAKDLPSASTEGLTLAAVPERGDPRDALVGCAFDDLPVGARVATGSVRRRAQLAWHRPDLTFFELRGNLGTRLEKAPRYHAIVAAAAALRRIGRSEAITECLDPGFLVPQVGQGALAVECRTDDEAMHSIVAAADHATSRLALTAERAWLAEVGGGCDLPVGAYARVNPNGNGRPDGHGHPGGHGGHGGSILLTAVLATLDGRVLLRADATGDDPEELGRRLARRLLHDAGGASLLPQLPGPEGEPTEYRRG